MPTKLYGTDEPTSAIMLQGFYWDALVNNETQRWYRFVKSKLGDIARAKISFIWLPSPCKERVQDYMGYTPMDYYDVGEYEQMIQRRNPDDVTVLDWDRHTSKATRFGTREELEDLLKAMKEKDIAALADIVINHRSSQQFNEQGERLRWAGPEYSIASKRMAWGKDTNDPPEIVSDSGGGDRSDDGDGGFGPNLAHGNPNVRRQLIEWLKWLKNEIGFSGWRYDYVKGFAPEHVGEYNAQSDPLISVGEYWDNINEIYQWIDSTDPMNVQRRSMAFDFPMKWHLNNIFQGKRPFRELGLWHYASNTIASGWPQKAVTFLDNHDSAKEPHHDYPFPITPKKLIQGYVFLLTHPGLPCIFWNHLYQIDPNVHDSIVTLARFRVETGIKNTSRVKVVRSTDQCYVATIDDKVVVKIGDEMWNPNDPRWNIRLSGRGWAIWTAQA